MAERRRSDGGPPGLAAALRRAARVERPVFSPALQRRVCAAVAAGRRRDGAGRRARHRSVPALGGLAAAVVGGMLLGAAWRWSLPRPALPASSLVVGADGPGIERLPTPGEIGADLLAGMTSLAAVAAGVPEWTDLAAFEPMLIPAADDGPR